MMKRLCVLGVGVLLLSSCATGDGNILGEVGRGLFTQAVDNKCRSELNAQPIYQTASLLMTGEQKQSLENKVCGCVAEEAPKSVSMSEIGQAVIDETARPKIVGKAVANTLGTCVQRLVS